MNDMVKKHWTTFLGALFILSALIYLFKYTVDQGWVTDGIKIGIGLLFGAGFGLAGMKLLTGGRKLAGEIISGLGVAVFYTTFSFAGIYFSIWDPMTVFLCMIVLTILISLSSFRFHLRILMNIALLGAIVSPLVMKPDNDQVFTLFLYLLVINSAFFMLSIRKQWLELRLVSFAGTWLLYMVYYFHFQPAVDSIWSMPYRYAVAAFVFYVVGFHVSSWKSNLKFYGLNLYLGLVNAVIFGLWSLTLLDGFVSFAYPMAAMGVLYILLSLVVYLLTHSISDAPVLVKFFGGTFLLLLSATQLGQGLEIKPLISVFLWGMIAALLIGIAMYLKNNLLKLASILVWVGICTYWFVVTWDTPRGEWFGVYIPFLNWGAVSWAILAGLGFYYSMKVTFTGLSEETNRFLSRIYSIVSHLIVGGLLTVQVDNLFDEYTLSSFIDLDLTLSVTWGVYALLLFLWGALSNQKVFRIFGSIVLVLVAAKALFLDLAGEDTIYKVLVLFLLGCISLTITYINSKWNGKPHKRAEGTGGRGSGES